MACITGPYGASAKELKVNSPTLNTVRTCGLRPNGPGKRATETMGDFLTADQDGETGWTLVGSWTDCSNWTYVCTTTDGGTIGSTDTAFGTTAKNAVSSKFGNTSIKMFRVQCDDDVTSVGTNANGDWYYYWSAGLMWKEVWRPDQGVGSGQFYRSAGPTYRMAIKKFNHSYNLKFSYEASSHVWNNIADYGHNQTSAGTTGGNGTIGGTSAGMIYDYWTSLNVSGGLFGVYNNSYTGSGIPTGSGATADGTLGMVIEGSSEHQTGQDRQTAVNCKVGRDDTGQCRGLGTTSTSNVGNGVGSGTNYTTTKIWFWIK